MNTAFVTAKEAAAMVYAEKIDEALSTANYDKRDWSNLPVSTLIRVLKLYEAALKARVSRMTLNMARISYRTIWLLLHACKPGSMMPAYWPELAAAMIAAGIKPRTLPQSRVYSSSGSNIVETITYCHVDTAYHQPESTAFANIVAELAPNVEVIRNVETIRGRTHVSVKMRNGKGKPMQPKTPEFERLVKRICNGKVG